MRNFRYIFLFVLSAFFAKTYALPYEIYQGLSDRKKSGIHTSKKQEVTLLKYSKSKVNKQKRPKKPKGIQVFVPNVSTLVFQKFYRYSDFTVHEVKGSYSLLLHYSHGKRGPPSLT